MQRSFLSMELIHHAKVVFEYGAHSSCKRRSKRTALSPCKGRSKRTALSPCKGRSKRTALSSCKGHFQAHSSIVLASSRVTPLNFLTDFPSRLIFDHRKYLPSFNRISIAHSFLIMAPRTLSTSDRLSWLMAHSSLLCFKNPPSIANCWLRR